MDLTVAQAQVVSRDGPRLRVQGAAGSGKTTALVKRWLRLARDDGPARLLVLCHGRAQADRFRDAVLAEWHGGVDALPITTWYGAAFDLLRRHGDDRALLTGAEHRAAVQHLVASEQPSDWPACRSMLSRAAFVDEVAGALVALVTSGLTEEEILAAARASGVEGRWADLLGFARRFQAALSTLGAVDGAGLIADAARTLSDPAVAALEGGRWAEVLIDDAQALSPVMTQFIERLAPCRLVVAGDPDVAIGSSRGQSSAWWTAAAGWQADVDLGPSQRTPAPPELVRCHHPAVEPDAIAGELLRSWEAGTPWAEMAVLVRRDRERARSVGRALARHGIPVRLTPGTPAEEPAVRAIVDLFAWASGEDEAFDRLVVSPLTGLDPSEARELARTGPPDRSRAEHPRLARLFALRDQVAVMLHDGDPVALVWEVWRALVPELVPDPDAGPADAASARALDAVVAFIAGLSERAARDPSWRLADELALLDSTDLDTEEWRRPGFSEADAVTISTVAGAAGRQWHTVVVAGCLEGELPRISGFVQYFDRALLDPGHVEDVPVPTVAARRLASLGEERRLFHLARSRASGRLVGTAAPQPGQVISRWVSGWPVRVPLLPMPATVPGADSTVAVLATPGAVPVHPDRRLVLSASQLMTYADCPLRYAFQYAVAVRSDAGVWAGMGSWVHATLAEFLDPASPRQPDDRSWERLEGLAEAGWHDDIASYQPQREEIRKDVFSMLKEWWTAGWSDPPFPDVVAVERPFTIAVGEHQVVGRIDRVDRVPGGVAVIDYKTGRAFPKDEEMAEDLQLATYHLAAVRDPELAALGPPISLRLLYLRGMTVKQQPITEDHEARTEARVLDTAERILAEQFDPSPEADCDHCDFHRLCPLQTEGREVGTA